MTKMSDSRPLVAVFTANSNSGKFCIEGLFKSYSKNVRVRGVFRSEEKAAPFRTQYPEMEIVTGSDANHPETLAKAFQGAKAALIVTPLDMKAGFSNDAALTEAMITHAIANGVEYIVYVGSLSVHEPERMKLIADRFVPTEKLLVKLSSENPNLKWTVLRGGSFMENILPYFKKTSETGIYHAANMNAPIIDTRDIGLSAAACLGDPSNYAKHHGKYYEMNGPKWMNGEEIAKAFSNVLGKDIKYQAMTDEEIEKAFPHGLGKLIKDMVDYNNWIPFTDDVKNLTGQHGDFEAFVRRHIDQFN